MPTVAFPDHRFHILRLLFQRGQIPLPVGKSPGVAKGNEKGVPCMAPVSALCCPGVG